MQLGISDAPEYVTTGEGRPVAVKTLSWFALCHCFVIVQHLEAQRSYGNYGFHTVKMVTLTLPPVLLGGSSPQKQRLSQEARYLKSQSKLIKKLPINQ